MDEPGITQLQRITEVVQRVQGEFSRQPRFTSPQQFFTSVMRWVDKAFMEEPPLTADTRKRDKWMQGFWPQEPHLAGTLATMTMIDKNRGWRLVGGRNQVNRYQAILRDAEGGDGWRKYIAQQSLAYRTAGVGAVTEVGRDGANGPLRALYHVDPTRFRLTGDPAQPGEYSPPSGLPQTWVREDFFTAISMPSVLESLKGVGYCELSRCLELAKLMVALYRHDHEQLGSRAPKGLLLLQNIRQDDWEDAMASRERRLDGMEREYFGGVAVLASAGVEQIDAKLVALSQLPAGFDQKTFTDLLIYGYALVFGIDPAEIWPAAPGLNRGSELQIQHRKATGKGQRTFVMDFSDQLSRPDMIPDTLQFSFDERDDEGELLSAEARQKHVEIATALYESGLTVDAPLLSREEARSYLADNGVIPREWTEIEEDVEATDRMRVKRFRQRYRGDGVIRRAAAVSPNDPIVRYEFPRNQMITLWDTGSEMLRQHVWAGWQPGDTTPAGKRPVSRQRVLYDEDGVVITQEDVDEAVQELVDTGQDELAEAITNTPFTPDELDELDAEPVT